MKADGIGAVAPGWWVSWEPPPTPQDERLRWGGSGQGPLGSLAGSRGTGPVVGSQGRFWVAEVPPAQGPTLRASPAQDSRAAHWPPLCRDQPRADGTRDQMGSRAPALMRAFPGSMNLALLSQPPKLTQESVPQCPGGTSFLRRLLLAVGEAGREGGSAEKLPWPWTSFSGVRVGEERACSLEGLGAPGRQEKGMGRPWLGSQAWWGQPSGGVS